MSGQELPLRDRCVMDLDDFDWWLGQKGMSWEGLARGDYGVTLDEAQLQYVCEDPVLWGRAFMNDPDNDDRPWTLFDYQVESARAWYQDVIHQDGAEVGKTREIVLLILWGAITGFGGSIRNPWILVGAPQQTHLDEIIMAVEQHFGVDNEASESEQPLIHRFWRRPKRHPHTMHRIWGPMGNSRIYYRPAGHDGEAFRGVHVNALALMDEAAKIKNKVCWSEFFRALKPGCRSRIYSVPDGDNETQYYRMTQQAIIGLPDDQPGRRLFRWPKTLMPVPFWSEERRRDFVEKYGGEDSPGYQRNVLGLHGQQENPVWPWELLDANIRDIPEYHVLKLLCNEASGELHVQLLRCELILTQGKKSPRAHVLIDRYDDLEPYQDKRKRRDALRTLMRECLRPLGQAVLWAGADLGFSKDPTEILVAREVGHELVDHLRIHARGVGYDMQCDMVYCVDEMFGFQPHWGVDFGNAGSAVVQILQGSEMFEEGDYESRMTGFMFSAAVDSIDEDGNVLTQEDKDGDAKPVRLPAKELATNLITARFQRRAWALPYDGEMISHLTNHTSREGQKHRIFDKTNDHTIDARRVLILRRAYDEDIGANDVFSSGVHRREVA